METSLSLLQQDGVLRQWSDESILPGINLSPKIRAAMDKADVMVFLFSPDFIASPECVKEWDYAKRLTQQGRPIFRIPIIVRECAWKDFLDHDDVKALPDDGVAVSTFQDPDVAWQQVYKGIKTVIEHIQNTFTPKTEFLTDFEKTEFLSQHNLSIRDLFVFPNLTHENIGTSEHEPSTHRVSKLEEITEKKRVLIHGFEKSGKTGLLKHVYLSTINETRPTLYLDLSTVNVGGGDPLRRAYSEQFNGDFDLWVKQDNKILILDNLDENPAKLDFVVSNDSIFDTIIVSTSSEHFFAYFRDEKRLASFASLRIEMLTAVQQENLIRRRLAASETIGRVTDALVDRAERNVNAIIISDRIVPRHPFFVLSILQTYEAYMPENMSITSYGHCYYVLIMAKLMSLGISGADSDVNACFNFAEHLAFQSYRHQRCKSKTEFDYQEFLEDYRTRFVIDNAILNRLCDHKTGIISDTGVFNAEYMRYFFLAKYLAGNPDNAKPLIETMCADIHISSNYLTLLFVIHHSNDNQIIDEILIRTMLALSDVEPATLNPPETRAFQSVVSALPRSILSDRSVKEERERERNVLNNGRELESDGGFDDKDDLDSVEFVNDIYRILKNNQVLGQILRNKHGNLEIRTIAEILEIVVDGGLRLVNLVLVDEKELTEYAQFLATKNPDWELERVRRALQFFTFVWVGVNLDQIVHSINVPELIPIVRSVVQKVSTPAYDLVEYFNLLDGAKSLSDREKDRLAELLSKHDDDFVQRIASLRTQHYINTHRSDARIEQSICSLIGIRYVHRPAIVG